MKTTNKTKYCIELTKAQLFATCCVFELFSKDYENDWDGINSDFKKGVDQTAKKLKKELKKLHR
jgi:hypothetical protein